MRSGAGEAQYVVGPVGFKPANRLPIISPTISLHQSRRSLVNGAVAAKQLCDVRAHAWSVSMATTTGEGGGEVIAEEDDAVLQFLDALDGYVASMSSLSSVLRKGWLDLAGARHSMGSSRVSSALFDLKPHSASSTVDVEESTVGDGTSASQPQFVLSKWGTHEGQKYSIEEGDINGKSQKETGLRLRHQNFSGLQEAYQATDDSTSTVDDQIQKKRSKSLSMFGTLISPKLRDAQVSFETALESIIEMANRRSMVLSTFNRLQQAHDSN